MLDKKRLFWSKVVLESYRKIPTWVADMDLAQGKLISLSASTVNYYTRMNTEELFDRYIQLNYRKHGLVNLKLLFEIGVERIPKNYRDVMKLKYVDGADYDFIAEKLGVHRRTVYKRLDRAVEYLAEALTTLGYTPEKFEMEYKEEPLLNTVKKRLAEELEV